MVARRVRLLTHAPAADDPPVGTPLSVVLRPEPDEEWVGRHGVERLYSLGQWLRGLHDTEPDGGALGPPPSEPAELVRLLGERLASGDGDVVERVHWVSLQQWAQRLSVSGSTAHGHLGLETVLVDGDGFVVLTPGGLRSAHPALDVGGVHGDLLELTHRVRLAGLDPAPYERLLAAFLTGYRGLLGGDARAGPSDLDTFRAVALRVATRSVGSGDRTWSGGDPELTRRVVEHCWSLAEAS